MELEAGLPRTATVVDEVSTRLMTIEERAPQDDLVKNNNRPQAEDANLVDDLATMRTEINDLLETRGSVTWALAGIEERITKRDYESELIDALLARLDDIHPQQNRQNDANGNFENQDQDGPEFD